MAYGIDTGPFQYIIKNGQRLKNFFGLPPVDYSFSPNSQYLTYFGVQQNIFYAAVDHQAVRLDGELIIGTNIIWDDDAHLHTLVLKERDVQVVRFEWDGENLNEIQAEKKANRAKNKTVSKAYTQSTYQKVEQLLLTLDKAKRTARHSIETQILSYKGQALQPLFDSIDRINASLSKSPSSQDMLRLGYRITLLAKLGIINQDVLKRIGDALSDSAVFHYLNHTSPFYDGVAKTVNRMVSDAFVLLGEPAIPFVLRKAERATFIHNSNAKNLVTRRSFRKVYNRLTKKWWQFWI